MTGAGGGDVPLRPGLDPIELVTRVLERHPTYDLLVPVRLRQTFGGTVLSTRVTDGARDYDAQVYSGASGLGGELWTKDMAVFLRLQAVVHPSLPVLKAGGVEHDLDAAYAVTDNRSGLEDSLTDYEVLAEVGDDQVWAYERLIELTDALAMLRSESILHRNLWAGTVRVEYGEDERPVALRLVDFEMSSLVASLLRGRTSAAEGARLAALRERPALAALQTAPEHLQHLVGQEPAPLDDGAGDVFSLGAVAAAIFGVQLPSLPAPPNLAGGGSDLDQLSYVRAVLRAQVEFARSARRSPLPGPLRDLLGDMLSAAPRSRPTASEVQDELSQARDDILRSFTGDDATPRMLIYMPQEFPKTVGSWGYIANTDPDHPDYAKEVEQLTHRDLLSADVVHSPSGAHGYVHEHDNREKLEAATTVLLGERFIWFTMAYWPPKSAGSRRLAGVVDDHARLVKYVIERRPDAIARLQRLGRPRALGPVTLVAHGRVDGPGSYGSEDHPAWSDFVASTEPARSDDTLHDLWVDAQQFHVDVQRANLTLQEIPFTSEDIGRAKERLLEENATKRRSRLAKDALASHLYRSLDDQHLPFGLRVEGWAEDARTTGESDDDLEIRPDGERRYTHVRLVERASQDSAVVAWPGRPPLAKTGTARPLEQGPSHIGLGRQEKAVQELRAARTLVQNLRNPNVIAGIRHPFEDLPSLRGLEGNARDIVVDLVTNRPMYVLHGPPGSGKTTVVAHAVAARLDDDRTARILVSAQAHSALDNLAERVIALLPESVVALRVVASRHASSSVSKAMQDHQIDRVVERLAKQAETHALAVADGRDDFSGQEDGAVQAVARSWANTMDKALPELEHRVHRSANVVFATCQAATPDNLRHGARIPPFDWVVIEEAAKAWPSELAIPLLRGSSWTLVGDHKQLGAHRREDLDALLTDLQTSNDRTLVAHGNRREGYVKAYDFFAELFEGKDAEDVEQHAGLGMLRWQFRMRHSIGRLVSTSFYEGELQNAELPQRREHGIQRPSFLQGRDLVWIDMSDTRAEATGAWRNEGEAHVVRALAQAIYPRIEGHGDVAGVQILTPYHQQRRLLEEMGLANVATIHSYQGREAEVVLGSLVRTPRMDGFSGGYGHTAQEEVMNVLLSRARRLLVLVGHRRHYERADGAWQRVLAAFDEWGTTIPVSETELLDK